MIRETLLASQRWLLPFYRLLSAMKRIQPVDQPIGTTPFAHGGRTSAGSAPPRFRAVATGRQNIGVGNAAQIRGPGAARDFHPQWLEVLGRSVPKLPTYVRTHARFAQIATTEEAVRVSRLP